MNESIKHDAQWYLDADIRELTIEDALADENFSRTREDVAEYMTIDIEIVRGYADMADKELVQFTRLLADFCLGEAEPDYDKIQSSGVKMALRMAIKAHKKRVDAVYLTKYQNFVRGKKNQVKNTPTKSD